MTATQALAFVEQHGIVLEAARRGDLPSLAEAVAGEPLRGSWWAHPRCREIFAITRAVRAATTVLTCRLVDGRISFVHERLWPALARLADLFPHERLARLQETHTARGAHRVEETPFPQWLSLHVAAEAGHLDETQARAILAPWMPVLTDKA